MWPHEAFVLVNVYLEALCVLQLRHIESTAVVGYVSGAGLLTEEDSDCDIDDEELLRVCQAVEAQLQTAAAGNKESALAPPPLQHWSTNHDILQGGAAPAIQEVETCTGEPCCSAMNAYTWCFLAADKDHHGSGPATETTHHQTFARQYSKVDAVRGADVVMDDDETLCDMGFVEDQLQDQQASRGIETAKHHSHELPQLDIEFAEDNPEGSPVGLMCLQSTPGELEPGAQVHVAKISEFSKTVEGSAAAAVDTAVAPTGFEEVSAAFLADMLGQDAGEMCNVVFDEDWDDGMVVDASQTAQDDPTAAGIHEEVVLASTLGARSSRSQQPNDHAVLPVPTPGTRVLPADTLPGSTEEALDYAEELDNNLKISAEIAHTEFEDHAPEAADATITNQVMGSDRTLDTSSKQELDNLNKLEYQTDDFNIAINKQGSVFNNELDHGDDVSGMHRQPERPTHVN